MKTNMLANFTHPSINHLTSTTVTQLFEQQVAKNGTKTAIRYKNHHHLTYYELNAKANVLAHHLRECGVKPNTIVALYLERSMEFVIAMLAVIKAGGAYLPMDINEKINRSKKILGDSRPIKILTDQTTQRILEKEKAFFIKDKLLEVTPYFQKNSVGNRFNPPHVNSVEDMVYVIYTSGSTGTPKGCMIPHRGVVRLVKNTNYIHLESTDRIAQIANAAFDAMTFEVWGALINGAILQIIPRLVVLSIPELAATLKSEKISVALFTPALLNLLVKHHLDTFDNFNYLIFGGEIANPQVIKTLVERRALVSSSNLKLINAYGPTECTTIAVTFMVKNGHNFALGIPIGDPISNTTTYILNDNLQPVLPGQIGELYLGGRGLALGYLNNPKVTAEKFILAPWDKKELIYKTGDLVYWQPNQGMMFAGRLDEQVKIHGFCVKLPEIEACILKNNMVNQAVVKVEKDSEGNNYLVAYVSFHITKKLNHFAFYRFLKQNLPHYMLPKKIIQMEKMPITLNGKIDRKQLHEEHGKDISYSMLRASSANDKLQNKPNNSIEQTIATIVEELLGVPKVSATLNIFDLGLQSLMLAELSAKLNLMLGSNIQISIIDLFTYPTIRALAQHISGKQTQATASTLPSQQRAQLQKKILVARNKLHDNF